MKHLTRIFSLSLALLLLIAQISISIVAAQDNTALSFTVNEEVKLQISSNQLTDEASSSEEEVTTKHNDTSTYNEYESLYQTVKVTVIVLALICIGLIICILVIKFSKKYMNEE